MKKFVSMFAFMATITLGAFTLASCGDDDVPSTPSNPGSNVSYVAFYADVDITHYKNSNPFVSNTDGEKNVKENLQHLMEQEFTKIDGVQVFEGRYHYDAKKEAQVKSAIESAMTKLEPTMQSQNLHLEGMITCTVESGRGTIWTKDFVYSDAESRHSDANGVDYYVINDSEVGVVRKEANLKNLYTGDIVIPETIEVNGKTYTVTAIGPRAFHGSEITSISLPKTITTLYVRCFAFTSKLKSITLPGSLKYYKGDDEMRIFEKSGITEVVLEEGITEMCYKMFDIVEELKKVVLPSTITEIPAHCFAECKSLSDITAKGTITSVGEYAFFGAPLEDFSAFTLKGVAIPDNAFNGCAFKTIEIADGAATSIGRQSFSNCYSVTTITVPASVSTIGIWAFADDRSLKEIHFKGTTPATLTESANNPTIDTFAKIDFAGLGTIIYVPSACVEAYKQAPIWSKYAEHIQGE